MKKRKHPVQPSTKSKIYIENIKMSLNAIKEEKAILDQNYDEEVDLETEDEGPPPLDPEELERMNDFCFQTAMELRDRNNQEFGNFVLRKQMEEMFYHASTHFIDEEDTCEDMKIRRTEYIKELKGENMLKRLTVNHLMDQIEANERLIERLLKEDNKVFEVDANYDYFAEADVVPPLTVEELNEEDLL